MNGDTWKPREWWEKERCIMYTGSQWMTTAEIIYLTANPNIKISSETLPPARELAFKTGQNLVYHCYKNKSN